MYTFNKTEQEKPVDAATWIQLEASPLDHLLLPTGQTAYCLSLCKSQSCGFVSQLTGCFVFYLKKKITLHVCVTAKNIQLLTVLRSNLQIWSYCHNE